MVLDLDKPALLQVRPLIHRTKPSSTRITVGPRDYVILCNPRRDSYVLVFRGDTPDFFEYLRRDSLEELCEELY
jgi:hypothetical protein